MLPRWLNKDLAWIFGTRIVRSITQAFLVIVVPIYLARLGFNAVKIGTLLMATTIGAAIMIFIVGVTADRYGRKPAMIGLAFLTCLGAAGFLFSTNFGVLVLASAVGTIGRGGGAGSGGAFGPFYPAEQPLITEHAPPQNRNAVFGFLSFLGVMAGALGSLLAGLPRLVSGGYFGWRTGYLYLFALTLLSGIVIALMTMPVTEQKRVIKRDPFKLSWSLLGKFALSNALNGFGIGFLGPLLTYWFYIRFGAGPERIGVLFTVVNLITAVPYLVSSRLGERFGMVRTVVVTRVIAVALTFAMVLMQDFLWVGIIFSLRMMFMTMGNPLRQSFVMGVSKEDQRSSMAAFSNLPMQLTSSLSPPLGGFLMDEGLINFPIFLGALFQLGNALLFWRFFRTVKNRDLA